jgi:hypothetical protein
MTANPRVWCVTFHFHSLRVAKIYLSASFTEQDLNISAQCKFQRHKYYNHNSDLQVYPDQITGPQYYQSSTTKILGSQPAKEYQPRDLHRFTSTRQVTMAEVKEEDPPLPKDDPSPGPPLPPRRHQEDINTNPPPPPPVRSSTSQTQSGKSDKYQSAKWYWEKMKKGELSVLPWHCCNGVDGKEVSSTFNLGRKGNRIVDIE